jgi:ribosomal protein L6P/L9E
LTIFLPIKIKYILLRGCGEICQNYVLIYNSGYLHILKIQSLYLNKHSTTLLTNKNTSIKERVIKNFFIKISNPYIKKLKFSGKGYKILKKGSNLNLYLNTSHNQWLISFKTIIIKTQKQRFLFLNKNINQLEYILKKMLKIRPINIFTKRGLRLSKQKVFKKIGKRSS